MNQAISTLRTVVIGMIVGLLTFSGIVLWLVTSNPPTPNIDPALFWAILGGLAVTELVAYFFVRAALISSAQRRYHASGGKLADSPAETTATGTFSTVTLIGSALAEGIGLFAVIVLMLTGDMRLLAFVGAALAAKLALFPTENRYRAFVHQVTGTWPAGR